MNFVRQSETLTIQLPVKEHVKGSPTYIRKMRELAGRVACRRTREKISGADIVDSVPHEGFRLLRFEGAPRESPLVSCAEWPDADGIEFLVTVDYLVPETVPSGVEV